MINLYPLRSTDPKKLPPTKNQDIYDLNLKTIKTLIKPLKDKSILIAAGGDVKTREYLIDALKELIKFGNENEINWLCIGLNKEGFPRHPSRGTYRDIVKYDPNELL